jgi:hypothetical protein
VSGPPFRVRVTGRSPGQAPQGVDNHYSNCVPWGTGLASRRAPAAPAPAAPLPVPLP